MKAFFGEFVCTMSEKEENVLSFFASERLCEVGKECNFIQPVSVPKFNPGEESVVFLYDQYGIHEKAKKSNTQRL